MTLMPFFLLLLLSACSLHEESETARSGTLTVAVDRQLAEVVEIQGETFSRYYPDARLTLLPSASLESLKLLFEGKAAAAIICGELNAGEESLFASLKRPIRREPIARDAIVCIVNRRNPLRRLSKKALVTIFSGSSKAALPLFSADDYRIESLFAAKTGKRREELHAWGCASSEELVTRVSTDEKAVGLLFLSSLNHALQSKAAGGINILSIADDSSGAKPYSPARQNILEGRYPLVTTVYYVYYSARPLAAGFGSWLSSSGQKVFEKGSVVPVRLVERSIILK